MTYRENKIDTLECDIEGFTRLIRSAIRKTCPYIDRLDMDDIEQEVKINIWKEILKSEKEIHNLGSYIWRVTYTTTSRIMKKVTGQRKLLRTRHEISEVVKMEDGKDLLRSPDHRFEYKELLEIIKISINSLIDSRRAVLKLYLMGMTTEEISEFFGWSMAKVRNLLSRGLADLRKKLQEKGIEYT
ncbi:MAG: sigma-70 family RNA polymerase sigma factor [Candidatus Aminicenantes bacterium]|nr:sigma-70 family RNA polymerase sigma factor [Candidatus Aminicenantes bacterium]